MRKQLFLLLLFFTSYNLFAQTKITECVLENGELKVIEVNYNPSNGDKTVLVKGQYKKLDEVYPSNGAGYAAGKSWFTNNERITFKGKSYEKYGLPRILGSKEVVKAGIYDGIGIYTEPGIDFVEVVYLPVRRGCEFQPYQLYCGTIELEGVEESVKGKSFTVAATNPKDIKGKLTYTWSVSSGKITKGQGTKQITVSTTNAEMGELTVTLEITTSDNCPVRRNKWVKIVEAREAAKPKAAQAKPAAKKS